jgi:amino acid transporter
MLGIRESAGFAVAIALVEIAGIVAAIVVGFFNAPDFYIGGMLPESLHDWPGVAAGAFIAFFAFIGFETFANLAEEVKSPRRTIPRAIIGAVGVSTGLYVAVTAAMVLAHRGGGKTLVDLFEGASASAFAVVGSISIASGVLVEIIMLARLFYGMAQNEQLPAILGSVNPRTRTPVLATALAGALVLAIALLIPFERLLVLANALTLVVFTMVNVALWRVHRVGADAAGTFAVPRWVPPLAAVSSIGLILAEVLT